MSRKTIKLSPKNEVLISLIRILSVYLVIFCNIRIHLYIKKLEKENCLCATTKLSKFLKVSTLVASVVLFIKLLINLLVEKVNKKSNISNLLNSILGIYILGHSICLIVYFFQLVNQLDCMCSNKKDRNLLLYPIILIVLAFIIAMIISLMLIISHP